jgi:hypothetical protein
VCHLIRKTMRQIISKTTYEGLSYPTTPNDSQKKIVLTSRADKAPARLVSCAIALLLARNNAGLSC